MRSLPVKTILLFGMIGVVIDRILKATAISGLTLGPAVGGVRFEFFPNPAIAFSLALPTVWTMTLIPVALAGFLWYAYRQWRKGRSWLAAAGLLVVTAAGSNYFDRLRYGYVVDYFSFGDWFPVFNLSDWLIISGLTMLIGFGSRSRRDRLNTPGVQFQKRS